MLTTNDDDFWSTESKYASVPSIRAFRLNSLVPQHNLNIIIQWYKIRYNINKKYLKNVGPIRHASRRMPIQQVSLPVLSRAACASMSMTTTTTITTTRDRGLLWPHGMGPIIQMCHMTKYTEKCSTKTHWLKCNQVTFTIIETTKIDPSHHSGLFVISWMELLASGKVVASSSYLATCWEFYSWNDIACHNTERPGLVRHLIISALSVTFLLVTVTTTATDGLGLGVM